MITFTLLLIVPVVTAVLLIVWYILRRTEQIEKEYTFSEHNTRPAGLQETELCFNYKAGSYISSNVVILQSKRPLTKDDIYEACEALQLCHPMLRSCIVEQQHLGFSFEPMPKIKLNFHVDDTSDWQKVTEEDVLRTFDATKGPLWRVTFLPNATYDIQTNSMQTNPEDDDYESYRHKSACVFSFHPAVVDGISCMKLLDEFLSIISAIVTEHELDMAPMAMKPPVEHYFQKEMRTNILEDMISFCMPICLKIPGFALSLFKSLGNDNPYVNNFGYDADGYPLQIMRRQTSMIPVEFSKGKTTTLVTKCEEVGVTVQSTIETASLVAMATLITEGKLQNVIMPSDSTVDMRKFIKDNDIADNYVGAYSTSMSSTRVVPPIKTGADFWKFASLVSQERRDSMKCGTIFDGLKQTQIKVNILKVADVTKSMDDSDKRIGPLLSFSYLGNCSFLDRHTESEIKLRASYSCVGYHSKGPLITHSVVTFEGRLLWSVLYCPHMITKEKILQYTELIMNILKLALQ